MHRLDDWENVPLANREIEVYPKLLKILVILFEPLPISERDGSVALIILLLPVPDNMLEDRVILLCQSLKTLWDYFLLEVFGEHRGNSLFGLGVLQQFLEHLDHNILIALIVFFAN